MALDSAQLRRIAMLARLEVSEADLGALRDELNGIFGMIEAMQSVDTTSVEPMSHGQGVMLRLREDRVTEGDQRSLFQSVAPAVERGLYLVPKVIE